ncbi:MAG: MBL fold metallo-hydrolase [Candidatus Hodarchaeales archaeon]|jgi:L-ascorbate metabolism protein UlaG (beta-lactamase superfamily)
MSVSNDESNIIANLYNTPLEDDNELFFLYFGWAGIILRTKEDNVIAVDIGKKSMEKDQLNSIHRLDLQLYSHTHWDHFHRPVTKKLFNSTAAPMITEPQVALEMQKNIPPDKLNSINSGESINIDKFKIRAIAGVHPRPITLFWVKWDECSFFHGADSGYIPLQDFSADIAFIPTGSPSPSCSAENGLKMVLDIEPRVVVAMHGFKRQMEKFKALVHENLPDTTVIIPAVKKLTKIRLE